MDRQRIFEHFVKTCGRMGRCAVLNKNANGVKAFCEYAKPDHPGCAIGCQPEFHQACTTFGVKPSQINGSINDLMDRDDPDNPLPELVKTVYAAFGAETIEDKQFLKRLQSLHDEDSHWYDLVLIQSWIDKFCFDNGLESILV